MCAAWVACALSISKLMLLYNLLFQIVSAASGEEKPKRSIMELHGLGAEIWEGVDAQEYVNGLREEWDHRP